jgi:hypothetical protein
MTRYYAKTRFWQGEEEFVCVPPLECGMKGKPTTEEVEKHLLEILKKNNYRYWGKDGVSFSKSSLSFGEMTYEEVATQLASPMSNLPVNGITYRISTKWEEVEEETFDAEYDKVRHESL